MTMNLPRPDREEILDRSNDPTVMQDVRFGEVLYENRLASAADITNTTPQYKQPVGYHVISKGGTMNFRLSRVMLIACLVLTAIIATGAGVAQDEFTASPERRAELLAKVRAADTTKTHRLFR